MAVSPTPKPANFDDVRSALFTPATRLASLDRAISSGADCLVLDLEDGVGAEDKAAARAALAQLVLPSGIPVMLRINHATTEAGLLDMLALRGLPARFSAIMLPKVETAWEVELAAAHLSNGGRLSVVALIETAKGLESAAEIASHPSVVCIALGGADLAADLGADFSWESLLFSRSRVIQAATMGGCASWDVPHLALADEDALIREARASRALGFSAKLAIHPKQIAAINAAFSPSVAEIAHSQAIVAALAAAGGGACTLDGRMIDRPVALAAEKVLRRASATNARGQRQ